MKDLASQATEIVRQAVNQCQKFNGRAVLLFSGGRDSSAVATAFCRAFPKSQLHLLFIDNGLLSRMDSTKRQADLIRSLAPETDVVFETKRVSQMMREAGMQQIEKDFIERKYASLLICVACKLVMNFSAARYAKELDINVVLDGYANRQSQYPEQTDVFMSFMKSIYSESNLTYLSPLYDFLSDKEKVCQTLAEMGVYIAKQEPVCMWANSFSPATNEDILAYCKKTAEIIRKLDPVLHV